MTKEILSAPLTQVSPEWERVPHDDQPDPRLVVGGDDDPDIFETIVSDKEGNDYDAKTAADGWGE